MTFHRRILHYSSDPSATPTLISDRAVEGCWFELHRLGGCGAGELSLRDDFLQRQAIDIGDWIALESEPGVRWYLGRVEQRHAKSPAGVSFQLEGMGIELAEVFPGGFGSTVADGVPPHRYARTDLFPHDPDYLDETVDTVSLPHQLVSLLLTQYVVSATHIQHETAWIEEIAESAELTTMKFRGEESVRSILKELALRARDASWGVNEVGNAFFLEKRNTILATFREGVNLLSLEEIRDRDLIYNRVLLTGDYVYDEPVNSEVTARGFYRWRGNYIQPESRELHGERRIKLWIPWIRTQSDSREFVREFFRVYAQPTTRYEVEVAGLSTLLKPWEGRVRLLDRQGTELITAHPQSVRVEFDRTPRFRFQLGPDDPHTHWPEPPQDERWELPAEPLEGHGGDIISLTSETESSAMLSSGSSAWWDSSDSFENSTATSEYSDLESSTIESSLDENSSDGGFEESSFVESGSDSDDPSTDPNSFDSLSDSSASEPSFDFSSSGEDCDFAGIGNLKLWLRADSLTALSDNSPVSTWEDQAGSTDVSQGTADKQPVFKTGIINGFPVVRGDGASDYLEHGSLGGLASNDYTWFFVITLQGSSQLHAFVKLGGDTADQMLYFDWGQMVYVSYRTGSATPDYFTGSQTASVGTSCIYRVRRNTSSGLLEGWKNGSADGSVSLTGSTADYGTGSRLQLFVRQSGVAFFYGQVDLAEVLMYSEALDNTQCAAVEACLAEKYGL